MHVSEREFKAKRYYDKRYRRTNNKKGREYYDFGNHWRMMKKHLNAHSRNRLRDNLILDALI